MSATAQPTGPTPNEPLIGPGHTYASITDKVGAIILGKTPRGWWLAFGVSFALLMLMFYALGYLLITGVGVWGINIPIAWGFDLINLVWWIGIGHAGTLISAILLLFRQQWRTSINRFAEAMTLFAVACASIFPIFHLGRPWLVHWVFMPYPSTLGMWQQYRSPLVWDAFAIPTYATVSVLFWYVGLIPDLATMRDLAKQRWVKILYGIFALGWRGSAQHWQRHQTASLLLAGLATPLVVSVHSIISLDFAVSNLPGWHVTVFPPYFVAGAIYAGFAMVLLLMIPIRSFYNLQDFITMQHLDLMAKVMLASGFVVLYGYAMEAFFAWYSGIEYEQYMYFNRVFGPYGWAFWVLLICNAAVPQLLWVPRLRRNIPALLFVSFVISVGMWFERFVIAPVSMHRDFLPSSWSAYNPTFWEYALFLGTFGLFFTLLLLFIRFVPMLAIAELREMLHHERVKR
jgi:molybdopterin-containing oxidoreductase family membrane subunit